MVQKYIWRLTISVNGRYIFRKYMVCGALSYNIFLYLCITNTTKLIKHICQLKAQ